MDEIDKAQEREEEYRMDALRKIQQKLQMQSRPADFEGRCIECEGYLPEPRIDAGYYRCVECVGAEERREKMYKK